MGSVHQDFITSAWSTEGKVLVRDKKENIHTILAISDLYKFGTLPNDLDVVKPAAVTGPPAPVPIVAPVVGPPAPAPVEVAKGPSTSATPGAQPVPDGASSAMVVAE